MRRVVVHIAACPGLWWKGHKSFTMTVMEVPLQTNLFYIARMVAAALKRGVVKKCWVVHDHVPKMPTYWLSGIVSNACNFQNRY